MPAQIALQQEISAANRRFMDGFRRDDLAGVAACHTEDAQFLIPHMVPIHGRAAIEATFRAGFGQGHTLGFATLELLGHGDSTVEIGQYTRTGSGAETLDRGKYIVIWKRVGGDWKIHRDMVSTNLPKQA